MIYRFCFWDQVFYANPSARFPSESDERAGRFVGFSEKVGHSMTYKILTEDTHVVIYRSRVRLEANGQNM